MARTLHRLPGEYYGRHPYAISGSLDGVVPGRRIVGKLIVGRLSAEAMDGLRPLVAFHDLRELELTWPVGIDLAPLAELPLEGLRIEDASDVDLAPIAGVTTLQRLELVTPHRCTLPDDWHLGSSLKMLMLVVDADAHAILQKAVGAIRWHELKGLEWLALGGAMTRVDLGFLEKLPQLRSLDLRALRHAGAEPSPLNPPFRGLPPRLAGGLIEVPDPERVQAAWLERFAGPADDPEQRPRFRSLPDTDVDEAADGDAAAWCLHPPQADGDPWTTYGSLFRAAEGQAGETEDDALRAARRRLRTADPALLCRLDFDPEADGTGIHAASRDDLAAALRILGVSTSEWGSDHKSAKSNS